MKRFTVFVASPSDVMQERNLIEKVISEINETHGDPLGYQLDLWRWEKNSFPDAKAPQELINEIITPYSIFVGIMDKHFGTPTSTAGSGTEEEYRTAYKAWENNQDIAIMFYFKNKKHAFVNQEELTQYGKVLNFKNELNSKSLVWNYSGANNFEDALRKHLCLRMNRKMKPVESKSSSGVVVGTLKNLWSRMDDNLKNTISIAYNDNRMAGNGGIKTADFFSAALKNPSRELKSLIKSIEDVSDDALPKPKGGILLIDPYIMDEQPWLSDCVAESLTRLSKALPENRQLTTLDVFVDIAKKGHGHSVKVLRDHNIGPEEIEAFLTKNSLSVIRTDA